MPYKNKRDSFQEETWYNFKAIGTTDVDLRNFMVEQGVTIAALFVTSAAVQLVTAALPFFLRFVKRVITNYFLSIIILIFFKFTATSLFKGAFTWTCFSSTT